MSRCIKLSALILIYLLVCAKSCDNEERGVAYREQRQATLAADSLRKSAGLDALSVGVLAAYDAEALVVFSDYADYLAIAADSTTAPAFREKVRGMIRGLVSPGITPAEKPFKIISASTEQSFYRVNDSLYEGSLHYAIVPLGSNGKETGGSLPIFLSMQSKLFGRDTLRVWTLFLGKME